MTSGKAHGQNREYQVLCRDVLQTINTPRKLTPYAGDGIDVAFHDLGGTNITFDVALADNGNLVVAECRRRKETVKQEAFFAFAHKVELLRKQTRLPIAGVFLTKGKYQVGAIKHANWSGIQALTLAEAQRIENFVLAYHEYDPQRERKLQQARGYFTDPVSLSDSFSGEIMRADGSREQVKTR